MKIKIKCQIKKYIQYIYHNKKQIILPILTVILVIIGRYHISSNSIQNDIENTYETIDAKVQLSNYSNIDDTNSQNDITSETKTDIEAQLYSDWGCYVIEQGTRDKFIDTFMGKGVSIEEPFYTYENEEDCFSLEFYYDKLTSRACGICYFSFANNETDMLGFSFYECKKAKWKYEQNDKMSLLAIDRSDGKDKGIKDLKEIRNYNDNGQLIFYELTGILEKFYKENNNEQDTIIEAKFTYREDGTLAEKYFYNNTWIWGSSFSSRINEYDEKERILRTSNYITHGSYEQFYLYSGDNNIPDYCLELDVGLGMCVPYFIVYE